MKPTYSGFIFASPTIFGGGDLVSSSLSTVLGEWIGDSSPSKLLGLMVSFMAASLCIILRHVMASSTMAVGFCVSLAAGLGSGVVVFFFQMKAFSWLSMAQFNT